MKRMKYSGKKPETIGERWERFGNVARVITNTTPYNEMEWLKWKHRQSAARFAGETIYIKRGGML